MLKVENLRAGYSAVPVLAGVSIEVAAGQFVSIVGPNGAGKTPLFKTISVILRPTAGAISFEARALLAAMPAECAQPGTPHLQAGRPACTATVRPSRWIR